MQIPDDPFYINELYQKAVDDIATGKLKSKSKEQLLDMKIALAAFHELNKSFSTAAPYMTAVDAEIEKRESANDNRILFWSAVIAAIFAVIASWPIVRDWIPTFRRADKDSNSQSPRSNSTPPALQLKPPEHDAGGTNH